MEWLTRWRRARVLKRAELDPVLWRIAMMRYPFTRALTHEERDRLRELTILFLHEKSIVGAGGLTVREDTRVAIAVQACVLILNLGLHYYRGWVEVIVYPDEFVANYEYTDEAGVVHHVEEPMSGESWERGPVIVSWADTQEGGQGHGYNVVMHEFAHKLDMLNGEPNGFPPLHAEMDRVSWSDAFTHAYKDLCRRVEAEEDVVIDPYGTESPAEFFAVASETFFEKPRALRSAYPRLYSQLAAFFRQDPAKRLDQSRPRTIA